MKWREQIKGNMRMIDLRKEDVANQCSWSKGV